MSDHEFHVLAAVLALVLDFLFGDSNRLYRHVGHPISWIGALIAGLERSTYREDSGPARKVATGAVLTIIVTAVCAGAGSVVSWIGELSGIGWVVVGVVASSFIAARGLHDHVSAVATGLSGSLAEGRDAVRHIVGRDPAALDEPAVARSALESLAENFSDGVVAPLFWYLVAGLPGLLAYKAINTLDSMIGHRNTKYLHFGRFAARLDDIVNWPAARISGVAFCLAAATMPKGDALGAWQTMRRDAGKHNSPNAGWPEAALAGALGLALAGPRTYGGEMVDGAWIGGGRQGATVRDIANGLDLYRRACALILLALLVFAFL